MSDSVEKLEQLTKEYGEVRTRLLDSVGLTAEQQKELATVDKTLRDLQARKDEQKAAGTLSLGDVTTDGDIAKAFGHLTPGEKARMYVDDRSEWQRGIDAQEREGTRRLLGTN